MRRTQTQRTVHTPGRKPLPIPPELLTLYEGMTTAALAKHFNVSRATISKWLQILREQEADKCQETTTISKT